MPIKFSGNHLLLEHLVLTLIGVQLEMPMDKVTLKIPRPLYDRIKRIIQPSGFSSVNEFVVYILRDLMSELSSAEREDLTSGEVDAIRKRLKNLGYI